MMPRILPWLAVLLLLLPKRNRSAQVFWLGIPLFSIMAASSAMSLMVRSVTAEMLSQLFTAAAFGLLAVWLLLPYLKKRFRLLTLFGVFFAFEVFALLTFAAGQDWSHFAGVKKYLSQNSDQVGGYVAIAVMGVASSITIVLSGMTCRGRFGGRYLLWLVVWMLLSWIAVLATIALFSSGHVPWYAIAVAILSVSGMHFGLLLPFLILSFSNTFHRERLKEVLGLKDLTVSANLPPIIVSNTDTPHP